MTTTCRMIAQGTYGNATIQDLHRCVVFAISPARESRWHLPGSLRAIAASRVAQHAGVCEPSLLKAFVFAEPYGFAEVRFLFHCASLFPNSALLILWPRARRYHCAVAGRHYSNRMRVELCGWNHLGSALKLEKPS